MQPTSSLSTPTRRPWPVLALAALLSIWLAAVGNVALWKQLHALPDLDGLRGLGFMLGFGVWIAAVLMLLLSLLAWPRVFKPVAVFLLLSAAGATHFMLQYGIVIDATMLVNVVNTDAREVRDLLSPTLVFILLGVGVLPAWWLWRQPVQTQAWNRRLGTNLLGALGALLVGGAVLFLIFQDFASVMRNHKQVRYLINPLNSLYAVTRVAADAIPRTQLPLKAVGEDATLGPRYTGQTKAPWLVLVVGETARAANFGLGGYTRNTTPELQALQAEGGLTYFSDVRSCGTNTQASVPCMFSSLGKAAYESTNQPHENLLDVLQRAGLAVLWVDNQSGCKGLCERVPNVETRAQPNPQWCADGECLDEVMIETMQQRIQALPPERVAKGVVVVLHQMGSHGPAYYKRSPQALKEFLPECSSNALQKCARQAVVNAYDNTIRYTDHFLAQTVSWLKRQNASTALLYVSDHGESLGENNLYLHGLPYALAPDEQKHVPMLTWLSPAMAQRQQLQPGCLRERASQAASHDNLFHSVLGLMNIQTQAYQPGLDVFAPCVGR